MPARRSRSSFRSTRRGSPPLKSPNARSRGCDPSAHAHPQLRFGEVKYRIKSWKRLEWCVGVEGDYTLIPGAVHGIALRAHWGRGYATEAARAAIAFAFEELGLDRIVAVTEPQNVASRRVMEKCGLSFVGVTVHEERTHVKYAITS